MASLSAYCQQPPNCDKAEAQLKPLCKWGRSTAENRLDIVTRKTSFTVEFTVMDGYRDEDISIQGQIPSSGQKHHRANSTTTLNTRRSKWGAWNQALYMLASAVLGIAFAVSHHFFHASLDGKPVRSTTSQQWNGRVSLAFSLLVRYCFKISIGIAFVQCFWAGVKAYATKLDTTDSVFMLLTSPLGFFKLRVWKFYPLLVTLSLLSWYVALCTCQRRESCLVDLPDSAADYW